MVTLDKLPAVDNILLPDRTPTVASVTDIGERVLDVEAYNAFTPVV